MRKRNGLSALADEGADEEAGADIDARAGVDVGSAAKVEVDAAAEAEADAMAGGSTFANSTRMILPFHLAPSYVLMARFTLARSQRSVM